MRKPTRRRAPTHSAAKTVNPRYDRSLPRSGRMPITLVKADTVAHAATSLQALAAALHYMRPCYAAMLQRAAAQIRDGYTEAQAIANYTSKPAANTLLTEVTLADPAHTERTILEPSWPF